MTYKGEELSFLAKLLVYGYSYKIQAAVNGQEVLFEPDEERKFRATIDTNDLQSGKAIDVELLKAIAQAIEEVSR